MTRQVEVRVISQVDWCWFCCCRLILHHDGIIVAEFASNRCQNIARVALIAVGREMTQIDNIANDIEVEVELVEADDAAVQMMLVVPVFRDFKINSVQGELTARDPIRDSSYECSEIGIALGSVASNVIKSQHNVALVARTIRHGNRLDDGTVREECHRHSFLVGPCEALDVVALFRYRILDGPETVDFKLNGRTHFAG